MVWYVVPCFRSRDHCPALTEEARAFFSLLSEDLKMLERSLAEGGRSVSLRWSAEAMNLLKKMQIELVALFRRSQLPVSPAAEEEEDWFDQFMQETATLLDFCNSLKCALSGINRYRMVADLMVHNIDIGERLSLNDLEFERLEKEEHETSRSSARVTKEAVSKGNGSEGCSKNNNNSSRSTIAAVMLAARATMVSVSLILVSAIVSPIPTIDMASEEPIWTRFPQLRPFADMLKALTVRFCERVPKPDEGGSRFVLAEHETVDSAVGDLRAQVMRGAVAGDEVSREGFLESVGLVRTSSAELREGVEMFDAVVDEVFDVVIKGRKEMLGMFRDEVLTM